MTTGELGRGLAHDLGLHGRPLAAPDPRRQQGVSPVEAAEDRGEHLLPRLHTRPHPHRPGQQLLEGDKFIDIFIISVIIQTLCVQILHGRYQ